MFINLFFASVNKHKQKLPEDFSSKKGQYRSLKWLIGVRVPETEGMG